MDLLRVCPSRLQKFNDLDLLLVVGIGLFSDHLCHRIFNTSGQFNKKIVKQMFLYYCLFKTKTLKCALRGLKVFLIKKNKKLFNFKLNIHWDLKWKYQMDFFFYLYCNYQCISSTKVNLGRINILLLY